MNKSRSDSVLVNEQSSPEGIGAEIPSAAVLKLRIATVGMGQSLDLIFGWARERTVGRSVYLANVHMLVEANVNAHFTSVMSGADLVLPDGMPLVWLLRARGYPQQERVAGMDLLPLLLGRAREEGVGVFLLGSLPQVLGAVVARAAKLSPPPVIAGAYSPPFGAWDSFEEAFILQRIRESGAGVILVSLGCPKQETWIAAMRASIQGVMIGLGAAFPVFGGVEPRAPRVMQRAGLEWCFRLLREPRRLAPRYLRTNAHFTQLVIREAMRGSLYFDEECAESAGERGLSSPAMANARKK